MAGGKNNPDPEAFSSGGLGVAVELRETFSLAGVGGRGHLLEIFEGAAVSDC
jgi:hypothetical protein